MISEIFELIWAKLRPKRGERMKQLQQHAYRFASFLVWRHWCYNCGTPRPM